MPKRVIITGGGTGGHIFPAVSIGQEIRRRIPDAEILFVGAEGGMETRLVPEYGFPIETIHISGIARSMAPKAILKNLTFPFRLLRSLYEADNILVRFNPHLVVGVGGYASGPLGRRAAYRGIPLVICEQNAYPGVTNKWLAKKARRVLLGIEDAAPYFPKGITSYTGNPIRAGMGNGNRTEGRRAYSIPEEAKVILSLGGSLGARTLNDAWKSALDAIEGSDIYLLWQCGKRYAEALEPLVTGRRNVCLLPFISNMADAYAAADLVVSRAGAGTISELIALSRPSILVPSPNVAEDHQTKNARALTARGAAVLVTDAACQSELARTAIRILRDPQEYQALSAAIAAMPKPDANALIFQALEEFLK